MRVNLQSIRSLVSCVSWWLVIHKVPFLEYIVLHAEIAIAVALGLVVERSYGKWIENLPLKNKDQHLKANNSSESFYNVKYSLLFCMSEEAKLYALLSTDQLILLSLVLAIINACTCSCLCKHVLSCLKLLYLIPCPVRFDWGI